MSDIETYLVTGANRGIGFEFSKQILQEPNSRLVAGARNPEAPSLKKLQDEYGDRLVRVKIDLLDLTTIPAAAEVVRRRFGSVDWLLNNAGFLGSNNAAEFPTAFKGAPEEPLEQLEEIYKINVLGPLAVVRAFLPLLQAGKRRTVINITSLAGSIDFHQEALGAPEPNLFAQSGLGYSTSKAALNMQTSILANQLHHDGFRVISLHPGLVDTDMSVQGLQIYGSALDSLKLIPPAESAAKQLNIIHNITNEQNGKFLSYDGSQLAY